MPTVWQGSALFAGTGSVSASYLSPPTTLVDGVSFFAASAGTGTFTFGSARPSFLTLVQAVADGELVNGQQVSYLAQDSLTNPTQREWGHGTFVASGSGSIIRTSVFKTVNAGTAGAGAPLNFTSAPVVSLTALAEDLVPSLTVGVTTVTNGTTGFALTDNDGVLSNQLIRTILLIDQTVNVDSGIGSDGLTLAQYLAGSPFRTLQHAWDFLSGQLDLSQINLTINVAAGTYTLQANNGWIGGVSVSIIGAGSGSTTINDLAFNNFTVAPLGTYINIDSVNLADGGSGLCLEMEAIGQIAIGDFNGDMKFTTLSTTDSLVLVVNSGTSMFVAGNISITGPGAFRGFFVTANANTDLQASFTFVGTPTFRYFYWPSNLGTITDSSSFSGSVLGTWFFAAGNGIYANDAGVSANPFPQAGIANHGGLFYSNPPDLDIETPSNGATLTISATLPDLIIKPVAALGSLTVNLPANFSAIATTTDPIGGLLNFIVDGYIVRITSTQNIQNFTLAVTDASTIANPPTTLHAGQGISFVYDADSTTWFLLDGDLSQTRASVFADTAVFVDSSTGLNTNPGTSALPWQTLQFACDHTATSLDGNGHALTINLVGAGPYTATVTNEWVGFTQVNILGAGSGTTTINDLLFGGGGNQTPLGTTVFLDSASFADNGSTYCIQNYALGTVVIGSNSGDVNLVPGASTFSGLVTQGSGSNMIVFQAVFTAGTYAFGISAFIGSAIQLYATLTFTGTPTFSLSFYFVETESIIYVGTATSYSGAVTSGFDGIIITNGLLALEGASTSALPAGLGIVGVCGGRYDGPDYEVLTPSTGNTVSIAPQTPNLILNPAGSLLILTVNLPAVAALITSFPFPIGSYVVSISTTQTITTLTLSTTDGSSIVAGPTTLAAGAAFALRYDVVGNKWFPAT